MVWCSEWSDFDLCQI